MFGKRQDLTPFFSDPFLFTGTAPLDERSNTTTGYGAVSGAAVR